MGSLTKTIKSPLKTSAALCVSGVRGEEKQVIYPILAVSLQASNAAHARNSRRFSIRRIVVVTANSIAMQYHNL
jgi:hypothetical protein